MQGPDGAVADSVNGDDAPAACIDPGNGTSFDGTMPCESWGMPQVASAVLTQMNSTLVIAPNVSTNGAVGSCVRNNVPFGPGGAIAEVIQAVPSPSGWTALRLGI